MFRYIVFVICILWGGVSFGQSGKDAPAIDYTQLGTPMHFWRLVVLDTAKKKPATVNSASKRKKREQDADTVLVAGHITSDELSNKSNLFVMLFSPTCEHCEAMTDLFEKNISLFRNSKLVLMTNPKFKEYVPGFMKKLNTLSFPQMKVGLDDSDFIKETFLYQSLPQINIYSSDRKLIKTFTGDNPIDSFRQYIN